MNVPFKTTLYFFLIATFALASLAVLQVDGQTKKKKVTYYSVNAGTVLRVRLHHELSSKTAHIGMPRRASAITVQIAACVYWPPFSRTPGTYPLM